MKKTLITLSVLLLTSSIFSQDFFHKIGINYALYDISQEYSSSPGSSYLYSGAGGGIGVAYQLGLNYELADGIIFSPTAYPSLGSSFITVNQGAGSTGVGTGVGTGYNSPGGSLFFFQLPVLGELYFGDREEFGGFVGAGFSYSYFYEDGSILGPQLEAGLHFNFDGDNLVSRSLAYAFGGNGITLRAAYTIPMNKPESISGNIYSVNKFNYAGSFSILIDL